MGSHSLLQGNLPDSGMESVSHMFQADSLLSEPPREPLMVAPVAKFSQLLDQPEWMRKQAAAVR